MRILFYCLLGMSIAACTPPPELQTPPSPEDELGQLFVDVQTSGVFPDSKTFADAEPLFPASEILRLYEEGKTKKGFQLKDFVEKHFALPVATSGNYKIDPAVSITEHINALWSHLTRPPDTEVKGSLLALPRSYVVPGGRFGEVYYWDSYFTMLGLAVAEKDTLIEGMVENFAHLLRHQGRIPNGNRSYYLSRSQPPFFSLMVRLLADTRKDPTVLGRFLPEMLKEYYFWMGADDPAALKALQPYQAFGRAVMLPNDQLLNRYYDDKATPRPESYREDIATAKGDTAIYRELRAGAESGWDFSSRWLKNPDDLSSIHTTEILPVDLNCLLFQLEKTLADAYASISDQRTSETFSRLAEKRKTAILKYFWHEGFFYDYDFVQQKPTKKATLAGAFPLFFGLATPEQAASVSEILAGKFLKPGGFVTTLANTHQQWDAPNGWAPLQYVCVTGLKKYGQDALADEAASRWLHLNEQVYLRTGKLLEKYNVEDLSLLGGGGEYPNQDGFGWTNGVYLALQKETNKTPRKYVIFK